MNLRLPYSLDQVERTVLVATGEVLACFRLRGGLSGNGLSLVGKPDSQWLHSVCADLPCRPVGRCLLLSIVGPSIGAPRCHVSGRRWCECTWSTKPVGFLTTWYLSRLLSVAQPTQQLSRHLDANSELCKAKCAKHRLKSEHLSPGFLCTDDLYG